MSWWRGCDSASTPARPGTSHGGSNSCRLSTGQHQIRGYIVHRIDFNNFRMLVENEAALLSALKTDLNKPQQEAVMGEIDFCRNEILGLLRNIRAWTRPQVINQIIEQPQNFLKTSSAGCRGLPVDPAGPGEHSARAVRSLSGHRSLELPSPGKHLNQFT